MVHCSLLYALIEDLSLLLPVPPVFLKPVNSKPATRTIRRLKGRASRNATELNIRKTNQVGNRSQMESIAALFKIVSGNMATMAHCTLHEV